MGEAEELRTGWWEGWQMATVLHEDPQGDGAMEGREVEVAAGIGGAPDEDVACRIARARLRLSAIRWSWSGDRGSLGGVAGASPDGAEVTGTFAGGMGEGWMKTGRGDGAVVPLPLDPLPPRALVEGDLPVPLGEPLEGPCLPPDRLPLPFAGAR
jgi:hypothetical protein